MAVVATEESKDRMKKPVATSPYGSWKSPISAEIVSSSQKTLEGFAIDAHHRLLWLESRPSQSGRVVVVRQGDDDDDDLIDITSKDFSVRSTAQEYGGGAFCVSGNSIIFSNFQDQRLYHQQLDSPDSAPVPLTPDYGGGVVRYADGRVDLRFNRYVTVREDHRKSSDHPTTEIVAVGLHEGTLQEPKLLVTGNDFYAFPRLDPKGERLAWIEWAHPNMHWDRAELWVGYISADGDVYKRIQIAGGDSSAAESPSEPKWSTNGELFFVTDRTRGFWNIYKWIEQTNVVSAVYLLDAEFTRPLWVYGISSYDFVKSDDQLNLLAWTYRQNGKSYVGIIDTDQASLSVVDVPFTDIRNIITGDHCLYIEAASALNPLSLVKVTLDSNESQAVNVKIIWSSSSDIKQYESYFSPPEFIKFPTKGHQYAYAYFYPPCNPDYVAGQEEKPPLLLESHGGPTDEARGSLNLNIQYWTSRGWAFVDVNYGGSSGYGREYRERLMGSWGIVDVDDCCNCAKFLVERGKVDGERLCITGCSAGGYTTLASLAFRETFKAGASLFGIADFASLSAHMHKFESHYIRNLVGTEDALFNRSPINFVDKFSCPVILFQGLEDTIVHPEQARKIYSALKGKGLPVALVEYEGEPHGFRKAENLKFTLEQQMVFFARTIGHFTVADKIIPIQIDNFD